MMRRITPLVAAAIATALLACGCSDDLVCPELVGTQPYISAFVVQRSDGEEGTTHAEVTCTADPFQLGLITSINERDLHIVERPGALDVLATVDDDVVVWPPGTSCVLDVTTNYGYATAEEVMPAAAEVTAPAEIFLGDDLELLWESVTNADYYIVSAVLATDESARVHGAPADWDTLMTTRETSALFSSEIFSAPGVILGFVVTVAGPFPEGGAAGNISGDGWGFFSLRYLDSGSAFDTTVSVVP